MWLSFVVNRPFIMSSTYGYYIIEMDKQQLIEKAKQITDPARQYQLLYECLDELGIVYQKTNCHKCRRDLYAILLEELELIEDASEISSWDEQEWEWVYIYPRPVKWKNGIVSKKTPKQKLIPFCESHPSFCMKQTKLDLK